MGIIFVIARSPADILQLKGLVEVARGFRRLDTLSYEWEHEILIAWCTYIPTFLNPIAYFAFVSEYRIGAIIAWKRIFGCALTAKEKDIIYNPSKKVLDDVDLHPHSDRGNSNLAPIDELPDINGSKTQVSDVL